MPDNTHAQDVDSLLDKAAQAIVTNDYTHLPSIITRLAELARKAVPTTQEGELELALDWFEWDEADDSSRRDGDRKYLAVIKTALTAALEAQKVAKQELGAERKVSGRLARAIAASGTCKACITRRGCKVSNQVDCATRILAAAREQVKG